ncbi:MAG: bifunctional UDP-N-acetylglucosamine diphosphorylase/glucosamine-1-phosphate N-acetyltransferase GlmU [Desulfovibrionales bacterium]
MKAHHHAQHVQGVVLAAGKGTRMHSPKPKVLQEILNRPLLWYVHRTMASVLPEIFIIVGHCAEEVEATLLSPPPTWIRQQEQLGTGHALQIAWNSLKQGDGSLTLVVNGDAPLLTRDELTLLIEENQRQNADLTFLSMELDDPGGYGRVVRNNEGALEAVIEAKDFDSSVHGAPSGEVNAGIYLLQNDRLAPLLSRLTNDNRQGEFYITQLIDLCIAEGLTVTAVKSSTGNANLMGINTPQELVLSEEQLRSRIVRQWMQEGVVIRNHDQVRIGPEVLLEPGADITGPCELYGTTHVARGARIESHCWVNDAGIGPETVIRSFSHVDGAEVGTGCTIGPFARVRPGTIIADSARVGNFVEIKKSVLGKGSKASHLTYLGDAQVGENVNIGAGTITCNYDGCKKHVTTIENDSFIGSNTALVAPVVVGKGSIIGAGSTITKNVDKETLAVARSRQRQFPKKRS